MNKKTSKQAPDTKVTNKRLDHTTKAVNKRRKGEMDKEELAKKVHALMGNIDSDEPPIEFTPEDLIYAGIIDNPATNAIPKKRVAKATVAKLAALKATPKKADIKRKSTSKTARSKTTKSTTPRSAAKPAKNNVSLAAGTSTSKARTAQKKTLAKSSKRAKAATLQDKKLTPKTKKAIEQQPLGQHTANNTPLALAKDAIDSSSNESKAVMPFYRRGKFQIGLGVLLCLMLAYAFLGGQVPPAAPPISKEIPIYEESRMGYYYREFTVKSLLDRYINIFDQKAWAVIQLKRAGQDTANAVKEREKAYLYLLQALKEQDPTGEITKDLQSRQAKIAKILGK